MLAACHPRADSASEWRHQSTSAHTACSHHRPSASERSGHAAERYGQYSAVLAAWSRTLPARFPDPYDDFHRVFSLRARRAHAVVRTGADNLCRRRAPQHARRTRGSRIAVALGTGMDHARLGGFVLTRLFALPLRHISFSTGDRSRSEELALRRTWLKSSPSWPRRSSEQRRGRSQLAAHRLRRQDLHLGMVREVIGVDLLPPDVPGDETPGWQGGSYCAVPILQFQ